jgi:hypothetical protein
LNPEAVLNLILKMCDYCGEKCEIIDCDNSMHAKAPSHSQFANDFVILSESKMPCSTNPRLQVDVWLLRFQLRHGFSELLRQVGKVVFIDFFACLVRLEESLILAGDVSTLK